MKTNQLLWKTTILHTFSTIRHVIDVSHQFNSNLAWISSNSFESFRVHWDFTAFISLFYHKFVIRKFILPFLSLVMETNSFTRLKLHTPMLNLKLKKWSPIWTFYPYIGVPQRCILSYCYMLLWLKYLPFSLMLVQRLKECK